MILNWKRCYYLFICEVIQSFNSRLQNTMTHIAAFILTNSAKHHTQFTNDGHSFRLRLRGGASAGQATQHVNLSLQSHQIARAVVQTGVDRDSHLAGQGLT